VPPERDEEMLGPDMRGVFSIHRLGWNPGTAQGIQVVSLPAALFTGRRPESDFRFQG
jgi:hypothetical protein